VSTAVGGVPNLIEWKGRSYRAAGRCSGSFQRHGISLRDREARQSFGDGSRAPGRKNYDVPRMVQAYEELYENLFDHSYRLGAESVPRSPPSDEEGVGSQRECEKQYIRSCTSSQPSARRGRNHGSPEIVFLGWIARGLNNESCLAYRPVNLRREYKSRVRVRTLA